MDIFGKKRAQEQRDRIVSYKRAFGGDTGREVLYDLMNRFHILNPHDGSPGKEGERRVVLHILTQLNINLAEFDKMLKSPDGEELK